MTLALGHFLLVDLRDDPLHLGLVILQLYLLLPCGGWGSLPGATAALACEPPSTSELLATAVPRLDHIIVVVHGGVDVRDRDLVTGFDVARRDEMHLRVAAFERRSGAWVAGVGNLNKRVVGRGRSLFSLSHVRYGGEREGVKERTLTHVGRNGVESCTYLTRCTVGRTRQLDVFWSVIWHGLTRNTVIFSTDCDAWQAGRIHTLSSRPPSGKIP